MPTLIRQRSINKVLLIPIDQISPNRNQPRRIFDIKELQSLADSIKENGLIQPITVRRAPPGYEIVAGERRLRAAKLADYTAIPCIVMDLSEKQSAIYALLENIQREDLNYFEEAHALKSLITECSLSQTELASRLGKAQSTIANKLRLLNYPTDIQTLLIDRGLSERQARTLLRVQDMDKLCEAIEYICEKKLSCAQTEHYVDAIEKDSTPIPTKKQFKPIVRDVRIFFNTIDNAIKIMNSSGINAVAQKIQSADYIEYVVKIPLNTPSTCALKT